MMGHTIRFEWELPEPFLGMMAIDDATLAEDVKRAAVLDWVRTEQLSWRAGAELLGMPLREFLTLMAAHKIPAAEYEAGWLDKELEAFKAATSQDTA
ncbi:MAG: UPF0175 family protein [Nitrospira sp.]|nr:UPF0175 family protein [Nitrospira sp.]MDH5347973.1 UPF0175 family protein [Nitrospira sp.]MDH5497333.1 UPF0175 family protein [Nitrospira sp.]MDH5726896.1 UPF0175 family protein [Nitrospira sp.]